MPQWIALLAIVIIGWLVLAVVGGFVVGRGLRAFDRRQAAHEQGPADGSADSSDDMRRAA